MQKRNDSKNQKKNHPLLPDFSAISAISAIFPPIHDPPCKGSYNSRRHWNETSSASLAITAAHPISPMNCSSDNTQTLATSRQLSYETTSVSQPLTAVNPLNPIKSQFRHLVNAAVHELSYETTSASQPLTAVNPLNPIKSQFRHLVNAHELSSTTQIRNPPGSASPPNAHGPAAIGNIFSRCFKIRMQLPSPVCLDRCMLRPYNPLVTKFTCFSPCDKVYLDYGGQMDAWGVPFLICTRRRPCGAWMDRGRGSI